MVSIIILLIGNKNDRYISFIIGQSWFEAQQVQKAQAYCYLHQNGYEQLWNQ